MNILIVGNGFDLAHDLPTRYTDFLTFLTLAEELYNAGDMKGINSYLYRRSHEYIQKYLLDLSCSREKLETIMSLIENNVWYRYFTYVLEGNYNIGKNWIDFESEIRKIVEYFDRQTNDIYSLIKRPVRQATEIEEFYSIYSACIASNYDTTYKDFIDKTYFDLQRLTECLEFYLRQCVDRVTMFGARSRCKLRSYDIMSINADAVLSFNYTNTFDNFYRRSKTYSIHFIHGSVGSGTSGKGNDMVLGVDEYWEGSEKDHRTNFNLFKKFVQRILKETGIEYKRWLDEVNSIPSKKYISYEPEINSVYIFGHSLDVTDKDILNEIISAPGIASTTIFYRNKQQQAEQIANLSKILGQDRLLEYVNSANPKIIFEQQQNMIEMPDDKE